jgi:hypothetical protein
MSPREQRRFRVVWIIGLPFAAVLGVVASANDWSVGWIYLVEITFVALAVLFVHRHPHGRSRLR